MRRITLLLLLFCLALPCLSQEKWGRDGAWGREDPRWGRGEKAWTLTDLDYIVDWWRIEEGVDCTFDDPDSVVNSWTGSINGIVLSQNTGANKPFKVTNQINGYPAIVFDGSDDYLQVTFGTTYAQPNTIILVGSKITNYDGTSRFIFDGQRNGGEKRHALFIAIEADFYSFFAGNTVVSTYTRTGTGFKIWSCIFNEASSILRVDGVDYSPSGDIGDQVLGGITLGAAAAPPEGSWSAYSITDIIVLSTALSTGQLQRVERWLNEHRGGIY